MKVKIENQITLFCFCLVAFVFSACSDEVDVSSPEVAKTEVVSRTIGEYVDFDSTRPFEHQTAVIRAASKRMDDYVKFENGKFVFAGVSADELKVSERVLAYMLSRMEEQNEMVKTIPGLVQVNKNTLIKRFP